MSEERSTAREIARDNTTAEIMRSLGRLEGKMDGVLDGQKALFKITNELDARTSTNEQALSNIKLKIGFIGAVIGAAFSAISDWAWRKITGHQ